eukprot:3393309-Pleurochrysis_carterae.AAC.1
MEQFPQDDAEGVHLALLADLSSELLWRLVRVSASACVRCAHRAPEASGQPKVCKLGHALLSFEEEHVGRFEVMMQHLARVEVGHAGGDARGD